jgi:F-type H+-transporting ATPase subunit delta
MATSRTVTEIARAFVAAAKEDNVISQAMEDLATVNQAFASNPALLGDFAERANKIETREAALREAFGKNIHAFVTNALSLLIRNDEFDRLPEFVSAATLEAQKSAEHLEARIERKHLSKIIHKKFGGTHGLTERIEPDLLGGIVIDVGDWHVDASVKGKLARLTHTLNA